jgi:hypothetical protein
MVIVTKTLSKTRSVLSIITTLGVVAAGFLAILFSSKMEKITFVSLVTGAKVAHADYLGGDASDSYSDGSTNASADGNDGCGPDGASEGSDGDSGGGGGDGE